MDEEKFWQLLSVKLSGEATAEELEVLHAYLQTHPEMYLQSQMLTQMWKKSNTAHTSTDDFFNRHLQRLSNQPDVLAVTITADNTSDESIPSEETITIKRNRIRRWLLPMSGVAAVLLFLCIRNSGPGKKDSFKHVAQNTVTTRKGSKSSVQLPDGTVAWLNADSKLVYNEDFSGDFREVSLQGEAYFDVVKDKSRPFIIHTKTIDIRVLGTAFNVRAYETEKNTETALFRGSVEVTLHNSPEKKIILKPNEKLSVNNKSLAFSTTQKDDNNKNRSATVADITVGKVHFEAKDSSAWETLWIKNKLVFDEETLEEVAQKIERWYDVKVIINGDNDLKKTAYSAIFENESLTQVMEALKITGGIKYTINKDVITIR
ncbi:MAG: FecR family protein [Chitinophagaceae bacterium]